VMSEKTAEYTTVEGMSMQEYYQGQVLQGALNAVSGRGETPNDIASVARVIAESMVAQDNARFKLREKEADDGFRPRG